MTGWVNDSLKSDAKKKTSKMRPVIVLFPNGEEKEANGWRRSYRKPFNLPANRSEAAIQQHQKIEMALISLCEMLAECDLRLNDDIIHLFNKELTEAKKHQRDMKDKARYRRVEYDAENVNMVGAIL